MPCNIDIKDEYPLTIDQTIVSVGDIITVSHGFSGSNGTWSLTANDEVIAHQDWDSETEWYDTIQLRNIAPNQYEVIDGGDIVLELTGINELPPPCGPHGIYSPPVTISGEGSDSDLPDLTVTSHWLASDERRCHVIGVQYTVVNQSAVPVSSFDVQYVYTGAIQTVAGLAAGESVVVVFEGANFDPELPSVMIDPSNAIAESDETNNTFTPEWSLPTPTQAAHCQTPPATTPAPITPTPDCISPTPTPDNIYPTSTPHPDCVTTPDPTPTPDCISPTPTPDNIYPTSTPHPDCLTTLPPTSTTNCITPTPTPTPNDFQPTATGVHMPTPTPTLTPHPDCPTSTPPPTPTPDCMWPTPTPDNSSYPTPTPHPDCVTETVPTPTINSNDVGLPDLTITGYRWAFDDRGCDIIGVEYTILNQSATDAPMSSVEDVETGSVRIVGNLAAGESATVILDSGGFTIGSPTAIVKLLSVIEESDETNNEFIPESPLPIPTQSIYCLTPEATPIPPTIMPDCTLPTVTPDNINPTPTPNPGCDSSNWPAYVADLTIVSHSLAFDDRGCDIIGVAFKIFNRSSAPADAFEVLYVDTGEVQTVAELVGGEAIVVTFEGGNYYGGLPSAIVDPSNLVLGDIEENNEYVPDNPLPIPTRSIYCLTPSATTPTPDSDANTSGSDTPLAITLDRVEGETAAPLGLLLFAATTTLLFIGFYLSTRKQ